MNTYLLFSGRMKLSELIQANYRLLFVFPRFGINLGFGEKTVNDMCKEIKFSEELFLSICNIYTFKEYLPDSKLLGAFHASELVSYLHNSHKDYQDIQLPKVGEKINQIAEYCDGKNGKVLERFFEQYRNEVINHFDYEENIVFPYIRHLSQKDSHETYKIEQFEKNHSNIEEKLNDLKNIIIKYLPENGVSYQREILLDLFLLEEDLNKHSLIEDKILVPLVFQLENKQR